ncbi:hypothetical protein TrLO_g2169 [Triparma laevis f. longispina]|uniref:Uncharacterized protein n=1 Tax=Triparma laevis f. longispina TaxID=1714387 RepID=A0A9W7FV43_9STRA|nr:hypothetical protein TrLO_g2169 [Triparma laevis f. longispina]
MSSNSQVKSKSKYFPHDTLNHMPRRKDDDSVESSDGSTTAPAKLREDSDDEDDNTKAKTTKPKRPTLKLSKKKDENEDDEDTDSDETLLKKGGRKDTAKKGGMFGGWGKSKNKKDENDDPEDNDNDSDEDLEAGKKKKTEGKKIKAKKLKKGGKHHEHAHKHSLEIIKEGLDRFTPSEKDIKGKPIHVSEAPFFVKANFGDGSGPSSLVELNDLLRDVEDEKSHSKSAPESVYVYIESASTGRFFRFLSDQLGGGHDEVMHVVHEQVDDSGFDGSREAAMQRLERLFYTGFLVIQGLLAGYSGETVYAAFSSTTDAGFVAEYASLANETRRFYFILTTLAFVGAMNNWRSIADTNEHWRSRTVVEKSELFFLVLIYVSGLCFTLIAGVYDMDFYYHNGLKDAELAVDVEWYDEALKDSSFEASITTWRALTIGRFVSVMIGWLVVCRILHRNSSRSADAIRESENLKHTLELARKRINQLTGAKLDKIGREDLLELAQTQRSALEQTEHVLDAMPKAAVDPFATMQTTIKTGTYNPLNMTGGLTLDSSMGIGHGSPTRGARGTSSNLPASISSKAPPALNTTFGSIPEREEV